MSDVQNKIVEIAVELFHLEPSEVTDDLTVGDVPQWDSFGQLNFIAAIEERLEIDFPVEELFELNSIKTIVEAAEKLIYHDNV